MLKLFSALIFAFIPMLAVAQESETITATPPDAPAIADPQTYLDPVLNQFFIKWPKNRTVNIVFHGHSVPSGYFKTPITKPLDSYPHLFREAIAIHYDMSVVNVIVTAIGGENSKQGSTPERIDDVLTHRPDVILIDYGVNDRSLSQEDMRTGWTTLIKTAQEKGVPVVLITPVPVGKPQPNKPLEPCVEMIRELAAQYHTGLADAHALFINKMNEGTDLQSLLSNGNNHPNREGHELVLEAIKPWFKLPPDNEPSSQTLD